MESIKTNKMTNYRWVICAMLFFATTVNYMDRQVLSLTWKDFIAPEFEWNDNDYGTITAYFSIFYAIFMLFAGKVVDWMGQGGRLDGHQARLPLGNRHLEHRRRTSRLLRHCHKRHRDRPLVGGL